MFITERELAQTKCRNDISKVVLMTVVLYYLDGQSVLPGP